MKISRTIGYAVQAMVQLAETEDVGPVSCRRLAEAGGMPERFLLQILRSLVTSGLLRSTRGRRRRLPIGPRCRRDFGTRHR